MLMLKKRTAVLVAVLLLAVGGIGGAFGNQMTAPKDSGNELFFAETGSPSEDALYTIKTVDTDALSEEETGKKALSIAEVAALTADTVVEITTESTRSNGRMSQYVTEGAGSGVIISSDGMIVTNNHVIEDAVKINVRLRDGMTYEGKLLGRDTQSDLALVKIEATDLKSAVFGDSTKLVVGEPAIAIGNPLGELGGTVTEGIISALDRSIEVDGQTMTLLQTTAAINPGNSGGGLFNQYGELIGIVNAKSSGSGIEGLGFAIPIHIARPVIDQLASYGYVRGRISLGLSLVDIGDVMSAMIYRVPQMGVYVAEVGENKDFKAGDRIVSINGQSVSSTTDVKKILQNRSVGETLETVVVRGRQQLTLNLTLYEATN